MSVDDAINERAKSYTGRYPWELLPHVRHRAREDRKLQGSTNAMHPQIAEYVRYRDEGTRIDGLAAKAVTGYRRYVNEPTYRQLPRTAIERSLAAGSTDLARSLEHQIAARLGRTTSRRSSTRVISLQAIGAKWSPHVPEDWIIATGYRVARALAIAADRCRSGRHRDHARAQPGEHRQTGRRQRVLSRRATSDRVRARASARRDLVLGVFR